MTIASTARGVGDVDCQRERGAARGAHQLGRLVHQVDVDVGDDDGACAFAVEQQRGRAADARGRAGDEYDFALDQAARFVPH